MFRWTTARAGRLRNEAMIALMPGASCVCTVWPFGEGPCLGFAVAAAAVHARGVATHGGGAARGRSAGEMSDGGRPQRVSGRAPVPASPQHLGRVPPPAALAQQLRAAQEASLQEDAANRSSENASTVLASIKGSSRFPLEALASDKLGPTFLSYLRAARNGMPSVFAMGVCVEEGRATRSQLLRWERLLRALLRTAGSGASSSNGPDGDGGSAPLGALSLEGVSELRWGQLQEAAARSGVQGASAEDVAQAALDFAVFRCVSGVHTDVHSRCSWATLSCRAMLRSPQACQGEAAASIALLCRRLPRLQVGGPTPCCTQHLMTAALPSSPDAGAA